LIKLYSWSIGRQNHAHLCEITIEIGRHLEVGIVAEGVEDLEKYITEVQKRNSGI
jgi:sensor c-di-GMP phosphodiesterase-like protein